MEGDHTNEELILRSIQFENLPVETTQEILEKLPLTSVLRCRVLSKWFPRITNDQHFAFKHYFFNAAKHNPFLFLSIENSVYFLDLEAAEISEFKKINVPFKLPDLHMVGSCNGYLCLHLEQRSYPLGSLYDEVTYIWNPFTKHLVELPSSAKRLSFALGLGFHPLTRQYKVVKIYNGEHFMQILTLGTENWRTLKISSSLMTRLLLKRKNKGVCVNGSIHWLVKKREVQCRAKMVILRFDLATEELLEIQLPKNVDSQCCQSLIELRGCLAMAAVRRDRLEIWVLKNSNLENSWKLEFEILNYRERLSEHLRMKKNQGAVMLTDEPSLNPEDVVCFLKDDKLLMRFKIGGLNCYDFRNEVFSEFKVGGIPDLGGFSCEYEAIAVAGSLIHIN